MARRSRRSAKRKKKPDQTTLIVILSGAAFLIAILLFFGLASNKPNKKAKQRDNLERSEIANNKPLPQSNPKAKPKAKLKAKRPSPKNPRLIPEEPRDVLGSPNFSSIHDLPNYFDLPGINQKSKRLTTTPFVDRSSLKIDLVGGGEIDSSSFIAIPQPEDLDELLNSVWLLKTNSNSKTLAELQFNKNGIRFTWNEDIHLDDIRLIHNSRLLIRHKNETKEVQLREPVLIPAVRLADEKSLVEYHVALKHPPEKPLDEILWSMRPANPNSEPFNHDNIGACTTNGFKKISNMVEWSPKNRSVGLVHFRYRFSWKSVPTDHEDTINLVLSVRKHYKINPTARKSKWSELTRDNFESEFLKTRDRYESSLSEFFDLYENLETAFKRLSIQFDNPGYIRLSEEYILQPFVNPITSPRGQVAIKAEMDNIRRNVKDQLKSRVLAKKAISRITKNQALKLYAEFERFIGLQDKLLEIRELSGKPLVMLGTFHDSLATNALDVKLTIPTEKNKEAILLASYPWSPPADLTAPPIRPEPISTPVKKPWSIPPGMNPFDGRLEHLNDKKRK